MPIVIGVVELPEPAEADEPDELHAASTRAAAAPAANRLAFRLLCLRPGFPWSFMAKNQPPDSGRRPGRPPPRLAGRTCRMPRRSRFPSCCQARTWPARVRRQAARTDLGT